MPSIRSGGWVNAYVYVCLVNIVLHERKVNFWDPRKGIIFNFLKALRFFTYNNRYFYLVAHMYV